MSHGVRDAFARPHRAFVTPSSTRGSTMLVNRVHHVAYRCLDAKQTVEWYGKHLDMKFVPAIAEDEVPSTKAPDPYMHVFLDAGAGSILAFFELPASPRWTAIATRRPGCSIWRWSATRSIRCWPQRGAWRRPARSTRADRPRDLQVHLLLRPQRPPPRTGGEHRHAGHDGRARQGQVGHAG